MHKPQEQVTEWHKKFNVPAPDHTSMAVWATYPLKLRVDLINEEAKEFQDASEKGDIVGMIDSICDLLYVTYGAAVCLGIDIEPFFDEVHRSNMTKLFPDGKPHYREDGKVLKPDTYSPPNLYNLLQKELLK